MKSTFTYGANYQIIGKCEPQKLSYAGAFKPTEGTLSDLAAHIRAGHPWMPAILDEGAKRWQQHANRAEVLGLDIDGGMTIEEAIAHPFIAAHCGLAIETASSTPDLNKFRLVFRLAEPTQNWQTVRICNQYLLESVNVADKACKDASRFFFGAPGRSPFILDEDATLPSDFVDQALAWHSEQERIQDEAYRAAEANRAKYSSNDPTDAYELARQALSFIPGRSPGSGNYDECVSVLMALTNEFGESDAIALAESWSPSIKGVWDIPRKIRGFARGSSRPKTIGSVFHIAKGYGFKFPERAEWQQRDRESKSVAAPQTWLQRINQVLKRRPKPVDSTLALRRELGEAESNVFEYEEGDRLATWKQAFEQCYRYILDISPPGDGKSHDSGLLYPADWGAEKAFYISNDRRNSTVSTLAEWQEVEARHNGLTVDPAGKLRRRKDGQAATVAANCARTEAIGVLRSKNIQGADGDTVCQTCPVLNACKFSSGTGYGFKHQRRQALMADRLRIHPASLPDAGEDFSYAETINIWDEASSSIQNPRSIAVSVADLDQLISHLACEAPQQFIQLQPLLSGLKSLLTVDQPRYGFSYHDVLKALPELDFSTLDWTLLSETLQPNLSGLEPPDEIDLDQLAPKERRGLGLVKRALIRETAQTQSEQAEILKQTVLKQWFSEFLGVLNGGTGDVRIHHGKLTLTLPDNRHRAVIEASKLNIFLDATLTRQDLALKLGCDPDEIFVCRQRVLKPKNLSITQVTDLGKLTQQRGDDKQRRVAAIAIHYQAQDPTTKVIDFKRFEADGAWWRDSRGVNDFLKVKTLLLVGTPIANIAHLLAEYSILTGTHPTEEDAGFKAFVDRTIRAEFYQASGRLRANRRPDEQLQIIILSDFDLGIPTNKVKASQITLEAAGKWERFEMAVKSAASQLKANGEKITQTAIAKLTGYSQQYLSRSWKLLLTLLETPYRESSKNSDPPPPLIKSVAEGIDAAINQFCDTPDQVLETINEAFFEWLEPDQWSQVWQNIQAQTQIRILESLALTLPADDLRELEAIA